MFTDLKKKVQDNFNKMSQGNLFYVAIDRDEIWRQYILGFPEAERQEHECNCCKSFLRQWSGIVSIIDGKRVSIWDDIDVEGYADSVAALSEYIHSLPITDVFLNEFKNCGTDKNFDSKREVTWEHFNITLPAKFVNNRDIDVVRGHKRTNKELLQRACETIRQDAVETVLELIAQGSLYKGPEYENMLVTFLSFQRIDFAHLGNDGYWSAIYVLPENVCRIRNTSIGQLLINLSEGMDLDTAVGKFEQMVAPTNYKRPTALVTPKMVEQAKEKLESLGLTGSLDRRYANESDLNAEDILYADKSSTLTDVFGEIAKESTVNPRTFSKVEEVSMQDFIEKIVPGSKSIEVLLENRHMPNMVSLLTAQDKEAPSLFKWNNPFSWNYTGGITDSIKERVKAAGGKVDGVLRVSLSWFNYDDLDLHVIEPNGEKISFMNRKSLTDGELDVDMNAGGRTSRTPVENITWPEERSMLSGVYQVLVNNYSKRETVDSGYDIQIEYGGEVFDISIPASPRGGATDHVVKFEYHPKTGLKLDAQGTVSNKEKWGLKTNQFHKVKNIMLSPNHWERAVGNKHFLFFLENCISDESPRPFFNEFLKDEFTENRKVFEILGSKVKVEPTTNQLSGVGFSETNRNNIIVKVTGKFTRTIKIYV